MIDEKKDLTEMLTEVKTTEEKIKISVLIEPNLYRDIMSFMKENKGSVEVEDQYGELIKGKSADTGEATQHEFMQLLETYEKMHLSEDKKEEIKKGKADKGQKTSKKEQKEKIITCSSCKDAIFDNPKDYRTHVKSGWHVENLKRKMEVSIPYLT